MEDSSDYSQPVEHSNIKLIYSYTEYRIKLVNDSITALNTKLGSMIALSGASIGFSINLPYQAFIDACIYPDTCYSCLLLKILVCVCLVIAIYISVRGFYPQAGGGMTPPQLLMDEYYGDTDENCRLVITKTWIEALAELESMRDAKSEFVKKSLIVLGFAAALAAGDIILASFLSMC